VAEASDLARALEDAIATSLSPHQRRVVLALLVDDVPIDVLAERLGSTRNALYKTLHDARARLRRSLVTQGYLDAPDGERPKSS
jgi:RNA polymerase sigma-70 factor (ECF subfamily)